VSAAAKRSAARPAVRAVAAPRVPASVAATEVVTPFRRSAVAPKRKRASRIGKVLARLWKPALVVALPCAAGMWLLNSPSFALAEVEVAPSPRVPAGWVRQSLAPMAGENVLALPLAAITFRVGQHPWVEAVEIEKVLPNRLRLAVTERVPAAVVERGGMRFWAEGDGRWIARVEGGEATAHLPLLVERIGEPEGGAAQSPGVPRALALLVAVAEVEPAWTSKLARVEVLGDDDFALVSEALPFPVLFASADAAAKARHLKRLLPELVRRYEALERVDLRYSRRIVLVPAAPEGDGERAGEVGDEREVF
jgi:cell division protein FtsQ